MSVAILINIVFVSLLAVTAAGGIFFFVEQRSLWRSRSARDLMREAEAGAVFLFDDQDLIDANPAACSLLGQNDPALTDWERFLRTFGLQFPKLRESLGQLAEFGRLSLTATDKPFIRLEAEYWDGLVRITYQDNSTQESGQSVDTLNILALENEVATLRGAAEDAPQLIWKEDPSGEIVWANRAYLDLATAPLRSGDDIRPWPPVRLFELAEGPSIESPRLTRRVPAQVPGQSDPSWFDVTSVLRGSEVLHFGVDANGAIRAEETRRSFVQTLGKTFAELSIGLAIFDKNRRLATFNPALMDLTGLSFEFLSGRPLIHTLLDRLREARMLPEPKNYISWREEIAALESAAKNSTYCENWDLPNGQTYRVTGKPHPDGALAFLFEDISAEISLTRRFRSEIETTRAVLDGMKDAVAVFSQSGALTLTNLAYADLWNLPKGLNRNLTAETAFDATRLWNDRCQPSSLWPRLRDFVSGFGPKGTLVEDIVTNDGRKLVCRVNPLPNGSTMVVFEKSAAPSNLRTLRRRARENLTLSA